ncbi:hypothetical protein JGH11_16240 [Dysgonomonas sp. Marseille-P4677]|uniref:hypothetical protein n=1 Tax=Dysgonomonas sp. Marseille-P4677 TaxID=2364790 RepID=UPI00191343E6|nr:hypothetical protein [Dysgonomonas sp. Marseille-P4677]MBK5722427.1 hypothetical protein [Dysgonomonas sp. Marseille-P4677]
MGMRVTRNDVPNMLEALKKKVEQVIIRNLQYVGEHAINIAREQGSYTDQTGNLRSSIGYIIAKDGDIKESAGFDPSANSGTEGEEGAGDGENFAIEQLDNYPKGYVLIIAAGMNYASYVESSYNYSIIKTKHTVEKAAYDVITFTEVEAKQLAKRLFEGLKI